MNHTTPLHHCRLIELPKLTDARGCLGFVEGGGHHIPFDIRRIYYLYDMPENVHRGGHGHLALQQFMFALAGSFDITLDDGMHQQTFHLNRRDQGLYICPMMWRDLNNFSPDAVCMVLASEYYDELDYFRDYALFLEAARR